jgi:hypothetical protein
MHQAQQYRKVGETKMNKQSSRSHCIFTIRIKAKRNLQDGILEVNGKLHMVDLAGSECAKTATVEKAAGVSYSLLNHSISFRFSIYQIHDTVKISRLRLLREKGNG